MPKLPSGVSIVTESALSLIFKDGPRGQFLCLTKDQDGNAKICAVDNNTGNAYTEDFNSLTAALYWLENQAATPNEAETYAAAKAAEQYDDPLREEIDRYIESERAAVQKLADQIEHYVNTAHEGRVTVQTKVAAILRHNKHKEEALRLAQDGADDGGMRSWEDVVAPEDFFFDLDYPDSDD